MRLWKRREPDAPPRHAWAQLNADGLFFGMLIIAAGLFDLFLPEYNPIIAAGNADELIFVQARAIAYVLAGLGILYSLLASKIHQEVWSRFLFLGAVAFQIWRRWLEFHDPFNPAVLSVLVLFAIFATASWFRLKMLLAKNGVTFIIPPRKEGQ